MLLIPIWTCIVCVILGREEKGWLKFLGIAITIIGATIHSVSLATPLAVLTIVVS
jgi:hypothetical protein